SRHTRSSRYWSSDVSLPIFGGPAQGTTYSVTVVTTDGSVDAAALKQLVEQRLAAIDKALSNYRDDSEIAALNRLAVGEWFSASRSEERSVGEERIAE